MTQPKPSRLQRILKWTSVVCSSHFARRCLVMITFLLSGVACRPPTDTDASRSARSTTRPQSADELGSAGSIATTRAARPRTDRWAAERRRMVRRQIHARGVQEERVLKAMRDVPRHWFIAPHLTHMAICVRTWPADPHVCAPAQQVQLCESARPSSAESRSEPDARFDPCI